MPAIVLAAPLQGGGQLTARLRRVRHWVQPSAPEPASVHRGLKLGDQLQVLVELYRRHARLLLTIAAVVQIPYAIVASMITAPLMDRFLRLSEELNLDLESPGPPGLTASLSPAPQTTGGPWWAEVTSQQMELLGSSLLLLALLALVGAIATTLAAGALAYAVSRLLEGLPVTVRSTYRETLRKVLSLAGIVMLPLVAMVVIVAAWCTIALVLGAAAGETMATGEGGLAALLLLIWIVGLVAAVIFISIRWAVATPSVMLEDRRAASALGHSWRLVAGDSWRVLGIVLLVGIAQTVLVTAVAELGRALFGLINADLVAGAVAQTLFSGLGGIIFGPILPIALTVLFYDLAARREGRPMPPMLRAA